MKRNYLIEAFQKTTAKDFPAQKAQLNAAMEKRLEELRQENAGASPEKQLHLEKQILPGIAIYETLQTVLPKEQALQIVHGYVEQRAWKLKRIFQAAAHSRTLQKGAGDLFGADPEVVRNGGGLCGDGIPDHRRGLAH